jgi:thioredoxin 1
METNFQKTINSREWVLVAWTADWCVACKAMYPILQEITDMYQDKLSVFPVDATEYKEEVNEYGVRGLPRFSLFHKGKHTYSVAGTKSFKEMSEWIDEVMTGRGDNEAE